MFKLELAAKYLTALKEVEPELDSELEVLCRR